MQAVYALAFMKPDMYRATAAHNEIYVVEDLASDSYRILVLEGYTDHCATKKLNEACMRADICMVVTELGIEKRGLRI